MGNIKAHVKYGGKLWFFFSDDGEAAVSRCNLCSDSESHDDDVIGDVSEEIGE